MKSYEILPPGSIARHVGFATAAKGPDCGCDGGRGGCGGRGGGCGSGGGQINRASMAHQFLGRRLKEWEIAPHNWIQQRPATSSAPQNTTLFPPPFRGPSLTGPQIGPSLYRQEPQSHATLEHWIHFPQYGCQDFRSRCHHLRQREDEAAVNAILWRMRADQIHRLIRKGISCSSVNCDDLLEMLTLNTALRTALAEAWSQDLNNQTLIGVLNSLNSDHGKIHAAYLDCVDVGDPFNGTRMSTICDVLTGDTLNTIRFAESIAELHEAESSRIRTEIVRLNIFRSQNFPGCPPC